MLHPTSYLYCMNNETPRLKIVHKGGKLAFYIGDHTVEIFKQELLPDTIYLRHDVCKGIAHFTKVGLSPGITPLGINSYRARSNYGPFLVLKFIEVHTGVWLTQVERDLLLDYLIENWGEYLEAKIIEA